MNLEKEIERRLNSLVKSNRGLTYKWISTVTGLPDRIIILNQKLYLVELKTATGKISARQSVVFDELGEAGFPVHVLRSIDDVEDFICDALR